MAALYSGQLLGAENYIEAAKYYRIGAERGSPVAQFGLGCLLNDGHGIKKNNAEALKWIERAARQEFEPAKKALGKASPEDIHGAAICYRYGIQVDIDHDQFLVFLKLAAKRGNALAQESLAELDVA